MSKKPLDRTSRKDFVQGSASAFIIYLGGAGLAFLVQLMLARSLGPHSFGIYAYVFAWISLLAYCAALGFPVAMVRFAAMYEAREDWGLLRGVVSYSERTVAIAGLAIAAAGIVGVLALHGTSPPELHAAFIPGFVIVPLWALLMTRSAAVRAFGGIVSALAPDRLIRDGLLLAVLAFWVFLLGSELDARHAMTVNAACMAAALGVATWALVSIRPPQMVAATVDRNVANWWKAALPLLVVGAANTLLNKTGVLWLGWVGLIDEAGIYGLVFSISFLVVLPRTAVDTLFAPAISRFHASNDLSSLQALMFRAAVLSFGVSAAMALVLGAGANFLLTWFGPEFQAGATALRILLLGQALAAAAGSQMNILAMTGHERASAAILIVSVAVNLLLTMGLVTMWGLDGAAWAMTLSLVVWNLQMAFLIWRRLGLWPGIMGAFATKLPSTTQ